MGALCVCDVTRAVYVLATKRKLLVHHRSERARYCLVLLQDMRGDRILSITAEILAIAVL